MKLSIIIPVYNEERTLEEIVRRVESVDLTPLDIEKELVIVDDGSSDSTVEKVRQLQAEFPNIALVEHERNMGKGSAIRTGLKSAGGEVVLIQDADLEYDPADYPAILRPFVEEGAKVVYGSRFLDNPDPAGMMRAHHFGNRVLTGLINLFYGVGLTDEATCYKAFRTDLIKDIPLRCRQFEFCPEVTAKIGKRGIKIREVPISYLGRSVEEGKKIAWKDGFQALWAIIRYRFTD